MGKLDDEHLEASEHQVAGEHRAGHDQEEDGPREDKSAVEPPN